jgi:adenylate cyclase
MAGARRKLTAILSADVVSYPRLMGADEQATLDALNSNRDVFRKGITDHDGRVVDTAGDSVLAVFDSVVEAVAPSKCNANLKPATKA